jgi:transcriptional regulator with XRE-family HTH domain
MPLVTTVKPDGAQIRARRERLGLSQEALAKLLKPQRHPQTISDVERGKQGVVSLMLIGQLARVLNVEPESLIKADAA